MSWDPCARPGGDFAPCSAERPRSVLPPDVREFAAEFATLTHQLVGTSTTRRPDAVSLDYQTAHSIGPFALSDPTRGLVERAWRVTVENDAGGGGRAYLERSPASDRELRGSPGALHPWEPRALLFSFAGAALDEIDVAFGQNAEVQVCAERATGPGRAPEVWLYWYNIEADGYTLERLGAGRSPRLLLDDPARPHDSDVLLFYIDLAADRLVWRQQRERYQVERLAPLEGVEHTRVDELARTEGYRVAVQPSVRDPEAGTWALPDLLATALYPVTHTEDEHPAIGHALGAFAVERIQVRADTAAERFDVGWPLAEFLVAPLIIEYRQPSDVEYHAVAHALEQFVVRALIIEHRQPSDVEYHAVAHALGAVTIDRVVVAHRQPSELEYHAVSHSISSFIIAPP